MSNTGEKGVSWCESRDRYQVYSRWRGKELRGWRKTLTAAIKLRDSFERRLKKPRTDRRITTAGNDGVSVYFHRGNRTWVVAAVVNPDPYNKKRRVWYAPKGELPSPAMLAKARAWRTKMVRHYYRGT